MTETTTVATGPATAPHRRAAVRFRRSDLPAWIAGTVLLVAVVVALAAPLLAPYEPAAADIRSRLAPPFWMDGGGWDHPLGTDSIGRDLLSRVLYGLRSSLFIGFAAVVIGGLIGVTAAIVSGYYEGRALSFLFGRLADVQQAIPFVVLALGVSAAIGASYRNLILILGVGSWVYYYRLVRSDVLPLREEPFILAQRTIGSSTPRILGRHVLPNVMPSILVTVTLFVSTTIMYAAALSFLGLGVQPPAAELGLMVSEGRGYIETAWWLSVMPGIALAIVVLAMNTLGDWLRDRFDPTRRSADRA